MFVVKKRDRLASAAVFNANNQMMMTSQLIKFVIALSEFHPFQFDVGNL